MKKKNSYRILMYGFLCLILANCAKKHEVDSDPLLKFDNQKKAVRGNGNWDALGYGYDVTKEYLSNGSVKQKPILNIPALVADNNDFSNPLLGQNGTTSTFSYTYSGATATEFITDINRQRSFSASAGVGTPKPTESGEKYFSASVGTESTNKSIKELKSRISYARHESGINIKQIFILESISAEILKQYLSPIFLNDINSLSDDRLIQDYGTHVLLDFNIGGKLSFNFNGNYSSQSTTEAKTRSVKAGLGFIAKLFNVNLSYTTTTSEMNKAFYENIESERFMETYGGNNSGLVINVDSEGKISQGLNIGTWQASVTPTNSVLTGIRRMVPIYEFVNNSSKKASLKKAIETYIKSNQITELGEVPIYVYNNAPRGDHYFTPDNRPTIGNGHFLNEGIAFYAFSTQKPNTVPIYVYNDSRAADHYFTPENKPTIGNGSFKNEGIAFYAYPRRESYNVPIYVYYSWRATDHYFTPDNYPTIGNGTFVNEGIAFYAIKGR